MIPIIRKVTHLDKYRSENKQANKYIIRNNMCNLVYKARFKDLFKDLVKEKRVSQPYRRNFTQSRSVVRSDHAAGIGVSLAAGEGPRC